MHPDLLCDSRNNPHKQTILHYTVARGNLPLIRYLLRDDGKHFKTQGLLDFCGKATSVLHHAIEAGHMPTMEM